MRYTFTVPPLPPPLGLLLCNASGLRLCEFPHSRRETSSRRARKVCGRHCELSWNNARRTFTEGSRRNNFVDVVTSGAKTQLTALPLELSWERPVVHCEIISTPNGEKVRRFAVRLGNHFYVASHSQKVLFISLAKPDLIMISWPKKDSRNLVIMSLRLLW